MRVNFNNEVSEEHQLIGGGPQGTLLGGLEYKVQSNNNADCVDSEDRFKFVDDLSILEVLFYDLVPCGVQLSPACTL